MHPWTTPCTTHAPTHARPSLPINQNTNRTTYRTWVYMILLLVFMIAKLHSHYCIYNLIHTTNWLSNQISNGQRHLDFRISYHGYTTLNYSRNPGYLGRGFIAQALFKSLCAVHASPLHLSCLNFSIFFCFSSFLKLLLIWNDASFCKEKLKL